MRPMSAGLTNVAERRRRFLFVDFFVSMWLLYALILLIFPFPVRRKRLAAPRLVFIFGIFLSCSWAGRPLASIPRSLLERRENHRHHPAFEARAGFDLPHVIEILRHTEKYLPSQFRVCYLPPPKHHGQLDLVSFLQESPSVARLEIVIVVLDPGAKFHLFYLNVVLLLLRLPGRSLRLVLEFPVVHELDHGGASFRCHFHEIQPAVIGEHARFFDRHDTDLPTLVINQTNRADPYLLIYTNSFLANIPLLLPVAPRDSSRFASHKKTRISPGL